MICTAPGRELRAVERRAARAHGAARRARQGPVRWHYALDFPHPAYLVTLVCGPFVEIKDRARRPASTCTTSRRPGARPTRGAASGARPHMIDFFSERIGVPYPHTRYSQIAVPDFIFGGMENTSATTLTDLALLDERAALDHDVDGAGLARARAPVVGRPRHLPRVVRGLAQRGLRDLLRVRLARARQGPRRGRRRARWPTPRATSPRRAATSARSCAGSTTSRSISSTRTSTRRAAACCTCCGTRWATRSSGARSATTPRTTRAGRSRRAISRAPSRTCPAGASTSSSTAGSRAPATPSSRRLGVGRGPQGRHAARRAEAGRHGRGAALQVRHDRALRARRPGARRAGVRHRGDARLRVPAARAPDAGDLRSRRRRPQVVEDGEAAPAVAAPARGGAPGHRSHRWPARRWPKRRPRLGRGAGRGPAASDRFWAGARRGGARARAHAARRRARRAAGRPSTTRTPRCGAPSPPASASTAATSARRWRSRRCCRRATPASSSRPRRRSRSAARALRWPLEVLPTLFRKPSFQDVIRTRAIEGLGATGDERALADRQGRVALPGGGCSSRGAPSSWRSPSWAPARRTRARRASSSRTASPTPTSACAARRRRRWRASARPRRCPPSSARSAAELDGRARRRMTDAIRELRDGDAPVRAGPQAARRGRAPARRDSPACASASRSSRPAAATERPTPPPPAGKARQ